MRFRTLTAARLPATSSSSARSIAPGGFRSEGLGAALFESMETRDPAALVGLPLIWLAGALRAAGLDPLAPQS